MYHHLTASSRVLLLVTLGLLSACKTPPQSMWYHRGPESLIDVSSEVVNLSVATPKDLTALSKWVATDTPTRAELQCNLNVKTCRDALNILEKKGVTVTAVPMNSGTVILVYERVVARDCEQQYRTKRISTYSEPSGSFGCATSANVVQMVSDKSVFINPAISDTPSAAGAVSAVRRANAPKAAPAAYSVGDSLAKRTN